MRPTWILGLALLLSSLPSSGEGTAVLSAKKVGETYEVDRAALAAALKVEIARVQKGERGDFSTKGDALVVKASHPGCAFRALAVPNGAVLREVGGLPVHSADDFAREMTGALVLARHRLDLDIVVGGRPLTLAYTFAVAGESPDAAEAPLDLSSLREVAPGSYSIDRSVANELLARPLLVASIARVVPAVKDGAVVGFKLFSIRPSSLFARLGLQNGDSVTAVNGKRLTSPEEALELFSTLRTASQFELSGDRRGAPFVIKIAIH